LQPEGDEDFRSNRRAARLIIRHLDLLVQRLQVERLDESPDDPGTMIDGQQLVQGEELHLDLVTMWPVHAGISGGVFCVHAHVLARSRRNTSPKQLIHSLSAKGAINPRHFRGAKDANPRYFRGAKGDNPANLLFPQQKQMKMCQTTSRIL